MKTRDQLRCLILLSGGLAGLAFLLLMQQVNEQEKVQKQGTVPWNLGFPCHLHEAAGGVDVLVLVGALAAVRTDLSCLSFLTRETVFLGLHHTVVSLPAFNHFHKLELFFGLGG